MTDFRTHDQDSAPQESRRWLEKAEEKMGFTPNVLGTMASSPQLLEGYVTLSGLFAKSSLDARERSVVLMAASRANRCDYCLAAHSGEATQAGLDEETVRALREQRSIADEKLESLRRFTTAVVEKQGWVDDTIQKRFLDAGYSQQQLLDVVLGVGMKTLSNYTNHIAHIELDDELQEWAPEEKLAATQ